MKMPVQSSITRRRKLIALAVLCAMSSGCVTVTVPRTGRLECLDRRAVDSLLPMDSYAMFAIDKMQASCLAANEAQGYSLEGFFTGEGD